VPEETLNRALAHAILRLTLGINIGLHGVQRFPQLATFARGVIKGFDDVLPAALVTPYAYAIPYVEALLGVLLIVGIAQRWTLAAGALVMASLTFGTALRGQHDILAQQLVYEFVYAALLATLTWDRFSLDAFALSKRRSTAGGTPASGQVRVPRL
jgi:thiosulfate dehydrogenase [quinone] large subunit